MRPSNKKWILTLVLLAAGALAADPALAHRPHHHGARLSLGFNFGWPGPYYYAPPPVYYYPTPIVVQPASPPVYVERSDQENPPGYWYYCADAKAYYPYVKQCPGGWQRVSPTPPPG